MKQTKRILHSAKINNNCPECYDTDGLQFTFTQVISENRLYLKMDKKIVEELYCHSCNQQIYPISWTPDIERVYQYHKKKAIPMGLGRNYKTMGYLVLVAVLMIILFGIGAGIFLFLN
ncbi:hypothetical protein [Constantimarinum furrinae]|uniref:Uncharacterized protein n=1 Tax=Constantimarinum furrinae TaxID=2562285 RepID=A0A7G8PSD0_9FLAO|nr:hypothetical protein [Constantimarinum furrinae]QNJ97246.1 hypothetical protein ALE3EI_0669 [Constantimarinum furrinae]